jgi:hypothetical protein
LTPGTGAHEVRVARFAGLALPVVRVVIAERGVAIVPGELPELVAR